VKKRKNWWWSASGAGSASVSQAHFLDMSHILWLTDSKQEVGQKNMKRVKEHGVEHGQYDRIPRGPQARNMILVE
jgi:hypothetical protein